MWSLVASSKRIDKQRLVLDNLKKGMDVDATVLIDRTIDETGPFIAIGQMWSVEKIVPPAIRSGRPFWLVDNGYYKASGKGAGKTGHYEFTYRGLTPILMRDPDLERFPARDILKSWRKHTNGHVLIALPGPSFGKMIGLNMNAWMDNIKARVEQFTDRRIIVRSKFTSVPLDDHLKGAHVVVTHSSNVAVDAIVRGIPAITAPTNPAAPVCSKTLADIETPKMVDRTHWWASLMCQQFTIAEMKSGLAWHYMKRIMAQVDG